MDCISDIPVIKTADEIKADPALLRRFEARPEPEGLAGNHGLCFGCTRPRVHRKELTQHYQNACNAAEPFLKKQKTDPLIFPKNSIASNVGVFREVLYLNIHARLSTAPGFQDVYQTFLQHKSKGFADNVQVNGDLTVHDLKEILIRHREEVDARGYLHFRNSRFPEDVDQESLAEFQHSHQDILRGSLQVQVHPPGRDHTVSKVIEFDRHGITPAGFTWHAEKLDATILSLETEFKECIERWVGGDQEAQSILSDWNEESTASLVETLMELSDTDVYSMYAPNVDIRNLLSSAEDIAKQKHRIPTLMLEDTVGGDPSDSAQANQCRAFATNAISKGDGAWGGRNVQMKDEGVGFSQAVLISSMVFTSALAHIEDIAAGAANYMVRGLPKIWYIVPRTAFPDFASALGEDLQENALLKKVLPRFTAHDLRQLGIHRVLQRAGDLIVTPPGTYPHWTFSTGFNVAESNNFWVPFVESTTVRRSSEVFRDALLACGVDENEKFFVDALQDNENDVLRLEQQEDAAQD